VAARLRERLGAETDVVAAYLFGSQARGTAGLLSDVDVAVLLRDAGDPTRHLELIDAVAQVVGSERTDVVVLNDAPLALAYRIIRDGELLVSRDERARIRHWVATVDRYLDMGPARRVLAEGLAHRLQEGRFGRS
jgi:predicted nucleotidyltransferase